MYKKERNPTFELSLFYPLTSLLKNALKISKINGAHLGLELLTHPFIIKSGRTKTKIVTGLSFIKTKFRKFLN